MLPNAVPQLKWSFVLVQLWWFLSLTNCEKDQKPRPTDPSESFFYPDDFCAYFKDEGFDYIVVGAGPGGAPVARRLAEDPDTKVLLLEAGGNPLQESEIPAERPLTGKEVWNIKNDKSSNVCTGYPDDTCPYIYSKFLGGCSVVNLMMYARGNHRDYDEWEQQDSPGWGWKNMKNYFLKMENFQDPRHQLKVDMSYHHKGGPFTTAPSPIDPQTNGLRLAFAEGLRRQKVKENYDPNGASQIGFSNVSMNLDAGGYRQNVAKAYLLHIPDNLRICKNSIVSKLTISDDKQVTGLEFIYNQTTTKKIAAKKEYILAGGPISTPQILERSGIGQKKVLEKAGVKLVHELEGVGENLQEQFANIGCAFKVTLDTIMPRNPLSTALTSMTVFLNMSDYENEIPDIQMFLVPFSPKYMRFKESVKKQYVEKLKPPRSYIAMAGVVVLRQTNRGYVHIQSTDPNETPLFNPMQLTSEYESKIHGEGCRLMRRAMNESVLKDFSPEPIILKECQEHEFNSNEEILCHARMVGFPSHHLAGSTKMGPAKDKMAVVDSNLRVHGIKNLRISDLGVMPDVPRSNTEIPTIAVSERAADLIKQSAGKKTDGPAVAASSAPTKDAGKKKNKFKFPLRFLNLIL